MTTEIDRMNVTFPLEVDVHTNLLAEILRGFNEHVVLLSVYLRLVLVVFPFPLGETAPCRGARTNATRGWRGQLSLPFRGLAPQLLQHGVRRHFVGSNENRRPPFDKVVGHFQVTVLD